MITHSRPAGHSGEGHPLRSGPAGGALRAGRPPGGQSHRPAAHLPRPDRPGGPRADPGGDGDAAEIGKQLARVHRPWLGYLWRASQIVLAAALLWAALLLADYSAIACGRSRRHSPNGRTLDRVLFSAHRPLVCLTEQAVGQYTLRVRSGELWSDPDRGTRASYLRLEVQSTRPWAELNWNMLDRLYAVDDRGNVIPAQNGDTAPAVTWERAGTDGPFRSQIDLVIPLPDPAAEGLVLIYDWLGAGLSLPVSWKEGTL